MTGCLRICRGLLDVDGPGLALRSRRPASHSKGLATVRGDRLVDASQLSRRAVLGIAFEVVPTESVIPRQMTDEGKRRQPFRRKSLPLCIYKVARMEATIVDEMGDDVKGVVHVV